MRIACVVGTLCFAFIVIAKPTAGYCQKSLKNSQAQSIHDSAIVIDAHEDTPQQIVDKGYDLASDSKPSQDFVSFNAAKKGNLSAQFFSIFANPMGSSRKYEHRALDLIDSVYQQAELHPDRMMMAFSTQDILKAHAEHKLAALMGLEGGHAIDNDLRILRNFYRLGIRYMTLTWNNSNEWADSCCDAEDPKVQHHNGMTEFGKQVVLEMNRLGMMVDVSHVSDKTFWDALATTKAPVIASHSSARAIIDDPHNLSDEMLRAVAKNGGVVNVNFFGPFLDKKHLDAAEDQHNAMLAAVDAIAAKRLAEGKTTTLADRQKYSMEWLAKEPPIKRPTFESLIDHIDHIAKVAGIDHVGLGSDFEWLPGMPQGIDSAADLPKITEALVARRYSKQDIHKILGGNMLRVFREVESVSRTSQTQK